MLKLGNSEGRLDVIGGRQVLSFGDERVIGPADWLNTGRTFDAVRMDLRHAGSTVSLFASSVVVNRDGVSTITCRATTCTVPTGVCSG